MRFDRPFLRLPRQYCAQTIAAEIEALGKPAWVPHPGNFAGNDAILLVTPHGQMTNGFFGPMAPTEHLLKCPYIMDIMADLGAVWGRSRLMGLAPGADVPPHVDVHYHWRTHLRIHIPVITNPDVTFTCGDESIHMRVGECWTFDSFRMHKVRNGGIAKRVHLVLDTVGGEGLSDLIDEAQASDGGEIAPPPLQPGNGNIDRLAFENVDPERIMSPWELVSHIEFVTEHVPSKDRLDPILRRLGRFMSGWAAAWARFGGSDEGLPEYIRLIADVRRDLKLMGAGTLLLSNEVPVDRALNELVFNVALPQPGPGPGAGSVAAAMPGLRPQQ